MKLKPIILSLVAFLLVGCASEPMINLSEENQSIVEEKLQAQQADQTESMSETALSETESETETEGSEVAQSVPEESQPTQEANVTTEFDMSSWVALEDASQLSLADYLPNVSYQIKQFSNGASSSVDYPNYIDTTSQMMQVESRIDNGEPVVSFYRWDNSQIIKTAESADVNPYVNHLTEMNTQANQETEVLLQAPLQVGTSWQRNTEIASSITGIYSQADLPAGELSNVVEVTSTLPSGELKEYYAQGEGLVATVESDQNGAITEVWQAQAIYHENRIVNEIAVSIPTNDDTMVEEGTASFKWQTNGNLASSFDEMFKELGILNDTITVQSVTVENDVVMLDFTPGVVAVLNSYDASEQAVIASIVTTLGNFFDTDQVRLSVNGNGMLPDTIEYPTNGIYGVSTVTQEMEAAEAESSSASESGQASVSEDETAVTDESQTGESQTTPTSGSIQ